jgi:hypothetical protein
MKKIVILGLAVISSAGAAQVGGSASPSRQEAVDPTQRVCRVIGETGSRLGQNRICMTRGEWEARRREERQSVDRAQVQRPQRGD